MPNSLERFKSITKKDLEKLSTKKTSRSHR